LTQIGWQEKMSVMDSLIEQLRKSVDRGEVTMSGLARTVGCTRQHLYGVINGTHQLSLPLAEKLAAAVGCEVRIHKTRKKISA